jgi:prepilin-type processing-associated H-X9-DG protein
MVGHSHQAQIFNTIVGANKPMVRNFFQHPLHKGNANVLYVDRSDQPCWNIIFYVLKAFVLTIWASMLMLCSNFIMRFTNIRVWWVGF